MAKEPRELNRKVVQHFRTTKSDEQIIAVPLKDAMAQGEIAVQLGTGDSEAEKKKKTGIWVLAGDGETPVRFASQELLEDMLSKIALANADGSINVVTGNTPDINVNIKSGEKVLAKDNGNGIYTNIKISGVTPSSTNVKEEYVLYATDGTVLGDHIKIYKDSALNSVYLGHVDDTLSDDEDPTSIVEGSGDTALCFIYQKDNGTYELVTINVQDILQESEFADGLDVNDHVVSVKIDAASEAFLSVSSDGVKISGVQDAIDEAVNGLNAEISGKSNDNHIVFEISEVSGKVSTIVVSTSDIASESALTAEVTRAQSAETFLQEEIEELSGVVETLASKTIEVVDDNNYIETSVVTAATGTTIGISGVTKVISASTSASTALADSYDVRTFAVNGIIAGDTGIKIVENDATGNVDGVRKIDFTDLVIDCGTF